MCKKDSKSYYVLDLSINISEENLVFLENDKYQKQEKIMIEIINQNGYI